MEVDNHLLNYIVTYTETDEVKFFHLEQYKNIREEENSGKLINMQSDT